MCALDVSIRKLGSGALSELVAPHPGLGSLPPSKAAIHRVVCSQPANFSIPLLCAPHLPANGAAAGRWIRPPEAQTASRPTGSAPARPTPTASRSSRRCRDLAGSRQPVVDPAQGHAAAPASLDQAPSLVERCGRIGAPARQRAHHRAVLATQAR